MKLPIALTISFIFINFIYGSSFSSEDDISQEVINQIDSERVNSGFFKLKKESRADDDLRRSRKIAIILSSEIPLFKDRVKCIYDGYRIFWARNKKEFIQIVKREGAGIRIEGLLISTFGNSSLISKLASSKIPPWLSKYFSPWAEIIINVPGFGRLKESSRLSFAQTMLSVNGGSMISYRGDVEWMFYYDKKSTDKKREVRAFKGIKAVGENEMIVDIVKPNGKLTAQDKVL